MQNTRQVGGKRQGAGRPKGASNRNRAVQISVALEMVEEGLTPLDVMRARMSLRPLSNGLLPTDDQFAAACALAPYTHPKLSAVVVRDVSDATAPPEQPVPLARLLELAARKKGEPVIKAQPEDDTRSDPLEEPS
jgi:hypothetical protein